MITSVRRARMLLCCAVEGGDPAVVELVQNLGADGAGAKIVGAYWVSRWRGQRGVSGCLCKRFVGSEAHDGRYGEG
jgi:hypothetical protein